LSAGREENRGATPRLLGKLQRRWEPNCLTKAKWLLGSSRQINQTVRAGGKDQLRGLTEAELSPPLGTAVLFLSGLDKENSLKEVRPPSHSIDFSSGWVVQLGLSLAASEIRLHQQGST
jgi:hypothetical protein